MAMNQLESTRIGLMGAVVLAMGVSSVHGQAWISFGEDPSRISASASIINDVDCLPNSTRACEKDFAVGDLDRDDDDDLVSVRIRPFMVGGGVSNILFMNENGTMVDRTNMADGFADLTQDRDVVIRDVNSDLNPDVIIASTFGEQPRVYMNLGCCNTACSPSAPCTPANQVACSPVNNNWCGLKYDPTAGRLPTFSPAPSFCSVAPGDVNNDQCPDLYFTEYGGALDDRLLINTKTNGLCTGFFTDETAARMCPPGVPCLNVSGFGTGVRIIDMNKDGFNDIVKADDNPDENPSTSDGTVLILYNDAANAGHFVVKHDLNAEFSGIGTPYMFADGDMNGDTSVDLFVVRSDQFSGAAERFLLNRCLDPLTTPALCNRPAPNEGTVKFASPKSVTGTSATDYPGGNVGLVDMDGDFRPDVLRCDVDVAGSFFTNTFQMLRTTVDPLDSMNVTVSDPIGSNCSWNTNTTYDFAVLDVDGDGRPDLWSGNALGNQLFMNRVPLDCDSDGMPDRCVPGVPGVAGTERQPAKCCTSPSGGCVNTLIGACCVADGGLWFGSTGTTCETQPHCPTIEE